MSPEAAIQLVKVDPYGCITLLTSLDLHSYSPYPSSYAKVSFTGMTGFTAVLRIDRRVDIVNRRAMCGAILERRLLKQALQTRPYTGRFIVEDE